MLKPAQYTPHLIIPPTTTMSMRPHASKVSHNQQSAYAVPVHHIDHHAPATPADPATIPQLYSTSVRGAHLYAALGWQATSDALTFARCLSFTPQSDPLVWASGATWALGAGRVLCLTPGEGRWNVARHLASLLPEGAYAFHAFTFDALASKPSEPSVCIVPEYLLTCDGTELTLTQISTEPHAACTNAITYARTRLTTPLPPGTPINITSTTQEHQRHTEAVPLPPLSHLYARRCAGSTCACLVIVGLRYD